ncbi:MAG: DUF1385 domain-containing protein [Acetivibrionales bacterium]|jgi:uncharacterized protein YqhQ
MKKTSIGGQALIEGIMMMGPYDVAIAVRKPDGEIVLEKRALPAKHKLLKIPFIRGAFSLFRQMVFGVKALMYSAEFIEDEEGEKYEPSRIEKFIDKLFGNKIKDAAIYFAVIVSLAFSIGLFILLPNLLVSFLNFNKETSGGIILYNLFEGVLRVLIFFIYLVLASKMKDIKRVWEYHGAEHKTIHCYEHEDELTVENVRKYTVRHPRCGTSFLFLVMIVSIIVFSFLGWHSIWINILSRLLLIPLVAGISYELVKLAGRYGGGLMKIVGAPGMLFQSFTTKEPDDQQIEVAIEAFKNVLVEDKEADKW